MKPTRESCIACTLFIGLEADMTKHTESCLQETRERPRRPWVRSSAWASREKEVQDVTEEAVPTSAEDFIAHGRSTRRNLPALSLFFQQRSKICSKRISMAVKARVHELHTFPSFLFCLLYFFLAVDLSLAGKSPSLLKYLNLCFGIATGLYEGQSNSPSQLIILQTLLLQSQNSFSCSLQRRQFQPSPKSWPSPHCCQCSVLHKGWQTVQGPLLTQNYLGQPK